MGDIIDGGGETRKEQATTMPTFDEKAKTKIIDPSIEEANLSMLEGRPMWAGKDWKGLWSNLVSRTNPNASNPSVAAAIAALRDEAKITREDSLGELAKYYGSHAGVTNPGGSDRFALSAGALGAREAAKLNELIAQLLMSKDSQSITALLSGLNLPYQTSSQYNNLAQLLKGGTTSSTSVNESDIGMAGLLGLMMKGAGTGAMIAGMPESAAPAAIGTWV